MPHLFVDRPRRLNLFNLKKSFRADFTWETLNAGIYVAGGAFFAVGSFFFFPKLAEFQDTGCLLFFVGSMLYVLVTCYDMAEVWRQRRAKGQGGARRIGEEIAGITYVMGSALFAAGSVFFSSMFDWSVAGAWAFIIGCTVFAIGAGINLLQITRIRSLAMRQLEDVTAVSFLVGSVLFATASVPYLWDLNCPDSAVVLYRYLAALYLVASALFVLGGLFNYWRTYLLSRLQPAAGG